MKGTMREFFEASKDPRDRVNLLDLPTPGASIPYPIRWVIYLNYINNFRLSIPITDLFLYSSIILF